MNVIPFIAIIAMVVVAATLRYYARIRLSKTRVRRSNLDPKAAAREAFFEERRRKNKKRRDHFVQLGLRPLQIALWTCLFVYVLSVIGMVFYYWQRMHFWGWLITPALLLLFWSFSSGYVRAQFGSAAGLTAFTLLLDYHHIANDFVLIGAVGRALVVVFALIIFAKMKDPVFSGKRDAV